MFAEFRTKGGRTYWLEVIVDKGAGIPDTLVADMAAAGWIRGIGFGPSDHVGCELYREGNKTKEKDTYCFTKEGTDLFAGWTEFERTSNMRVAKRILAKHKIPSSRRTMSIGELL